MGKGERETGKQRKRALGDYGSKTVGRRGLEIGEGKSGIANHKLGIWESSLNSSVKLAKIIVL